MGRSNILRGQLVGLVEIAGICGVEKETTYRWRSRNVLPDPLDTVSGTPIWWRDEIERWARQTGRLEEQAEKELVSP